MGYRNCIFFAAVAMAVCCVLGGAAAADVDYSGKYQSSTMNVEIIGQSDGTYAGTIHLNGSDLPLQGQVRNGILEGTFTSHGQDFVFTATLEGDEMTLQSGTSTFTLKRPPAPPPAPPEVVVPPASAAPAAAAPPAPVAAPEPVAPPAPAAAPVLPVTPPPPPAPAPVVLPAPPPPATPPAHPVAAAPPGRPARSLEFERVVIKDTDITGMDAYTMLLPKDWKYTGQILWNTGRPAAPWDLLVHATNADETLAFSSAPSLMMVWSSSYEKNSKQMGGSVLGCPIVKPADGPISAIKTVIIPTYLKAIAGNYQVVSSEDLSKAARAYAPTYNKSGQPHETVKAGKVRIEYVVNGKSMEQEIFCVYLSSKSQGRIVWGLDHIMSYRAEKGALDAAMPTFAFMSVSLQPTPKFFDAGQQITDKLLAGFYQKPEAQRVQMMKQIAQQEQAEPKVSQVTMSDWEAHQKSADAAFEHYVSGAVRGVKAYVDPDDSNVIIQVDKSFSRAFVNNNHVIVTDGQNFTPPSGYTEMAPLPFSR